jgi:hypothetical protein
MFMCDGVAISARSIVFLTLVPGVMPQVREKAKVSKCHHPRMLRPATCLVLNFRGKRLQSRLADIRESLRQSGCQRLDRLVVQVKVTDGEAPAWHEKGFDIEYLRQKVDRQRPAAKLIVKTGQAAQPELEISKNNINIGRTRNVEDERGHIVRRNDLVFDETSDGVSNSVSRAHAHIWFDENIGAFRVCDDNSAQGTYIFRDDHLTEVPRNSVNGMKLRPNDEIYLGKAVILFQVANHSATS